MEAPMKRTAALQPCGVAIEEPDLAAVSEADVAAWNAFDALMDEESPQTPFELHRDAVRTPRDTLIVRLFVARDPDGSPVAEARAVATRAAEHRDICHAQLSVRPDWRGRGVAGALMHRVIDAAEAADRLRLVGWTSDRVPAGERFARRMGASPEQTHFATRLRLRDVDPSTLRTWIEQGAVRAADYSLHAIVGPYPDELVEPIFDLHGVIHTVRPGSLQMRGMVLTIEEVRKHGRNGVAAGRWTLYVRHISTGDIVGFTEARVSACQPTVLEHLNTAVRPSHRGRGLCKWMKATLVERVMRERPEIEEIHTATFGSNAAMLGINRELGFTPFVTGTAWQVPIARVRACLDASSSV
jgi:GNAT superfamily N-acetyltransferase